MEASDHERLGALVARLDHLRPALVGVPRAGARLGQLLRALRALAAHHKELRKLDPDGTRRAARRVLLACGTVAQTADALRVLLAPGRGPHAEARNAPLAEIAGVVAPLVRDAAEVLTRIATADLALVTEGRRFGGVRDA